MNVVETDEELGLATEAFWRVATRCGLPDDWKRLDRYVRKLTRRDPERLSPRDWVLLAGALEEAPR